MKGSNLKILPAYRMYQAPEGGGEKPLRTSYLKDLSEGSASRGGGGTPAHRHGQKLTGQNLTANSQQCRARGIVTLERAGSCPVVNTLDSTRQEPSDSRGMTKPASETAARLFKVRHGLGRFRESDGRAITIKDTITDGASGPDVGTRDNLTGTTLINAIDANGETVNDNLKGVTELRAILDEGVNS